MNNITLIATTNKGKLEEITYILKNFLPNSKFVSLEHFEKIEPPKEIFDTFEENANLKANFYFNYFKVPVIVEDSGFCVDKLNGLPGVHSADWGEDGSFTKAIDRIYKMLKGGKSKACFKSTIVYKNHIKTLTSQGVVNGTIAERAKGCYGFGFDPCFIPEGLNKTFAEMTTEEKSSLSHRKRALQGLISQL